MAGLPLQGETAGESTGLLEDLLKANLRKAVETFETISEEDREDLKKALSILEE
jgi:predicted ribonuclease toxin of YeeF-YezG toxin-antitoxin module